MSTTKNTLAAFFGGLLVMGMLTNGKVGKGFYFFATNPRFSAPKAAGESLHHLGKYPEEETSDRTWRKLAADGFQRDLERMEWTWNREIQWKSGPQP